MDFSYRGYTHCSGRVQRKDIGGVGSFGRDPEGTLWTMFRTESLEVVLHVVEVRWAPSNDDYKG